jgi:tetratricopeptide (TPR) repeat protein
MLKIKSLLSLLLLSFLATSCTAAGGEPIRDYQVLLTALHETSDPATDTILVNIQDRIYNAFVGSFMERSPKGLDAIEARLETLGEGNTNNIIHYWRAYAAYYKAIYHIKFGNQEGSQAATEEGIEILQNLEKKSSEDYALLAMLQSFSIQFHSGIEAPFISGRVQANGEKALELDDKNLRAYYVLGSSDYYTPEKYGGGTKVETYLKQAIALDNQSMKNPYLPSWGKDSAYELLIRHFIKKEQYDEAKALFKEAIAIYPENYMLNQLSKKLIDK